MAKARSRREAIRKLAALRRRLAAAEDELARTHAQRKRAEEAFDAAADRFIEDFRPWIRPMRRG